MNIVSLDLSPFSADYEKHGCVLIPQFLDTSVMRFLEIAKNQPFVRRPILDDLSSEYTLSNPLLQMKLDVIFNQPDFLKAMSSLTGKVIKFTKQRLYYLDPSCTTLPWHDDSYEKDDRVAALRIELSSENYVGGDLVIRAHGKEHSFGHLKKGEGVLFKVEAGRYFHQVTPLESGVRWSFIVFLCT